MVSYDGNLFKARKFYEHYSSHDKCHCKGTMPFLLHIALI